MNYDKPPKMQWEEFRDMLQLMLDFHSLTKPDQQAILLMIDGLKYRNGETINLTYTGPNPAEDK